MSFKNDLKLLTKRSVANFGYKVQNVAKPLLLHPNSQLEMSFSYVIAHHMLKNKQFSFIQIGAFDGVSGDPIADYVKEYGWQGILVEPQSEAFKKLQENYKGSPQLILKNAAISNKNEVRDLYKIRAGVEGLPSWNQQVASFNRDTLMIYKGLIPDIEKFIEIEKVNCITFADLYQDIGPDGVDLIQIDAEGYDAEILKMIDFSKIKPCIIHYEHKNLSKNDRDSSLTLLLAQGYKILVEDTGDTTAYLV